MCHCQCRPSMFAIKKFTCRKHPLLLGWEKDYLWFWADPHVIWEGRVRLFLLRNSGFQCVIMGVAMCVVVNDVVTKWGSMCDGQGLANWGSAYISNILICIYVLDNYTSRARRMQVLGFISLPLYLYFTSLIYICIHLGLRGPKRGGVVKISQQATQWSWW